MKYVSYILIFIVAAVAVFLAFRALRTPGDLVEDFDLRDGGSASAEALADSAEVGDNNIIDSKGQLDISRGELEANSAGIMITDGVKHLVPLDKIRGGGPPKDGIPSIDDPKFVSVAEAAEYLDDNKLGIAVEKDGAWRFYPFQILVWHEIVNDTFKGEPLLVTYCPLCQTGIVFKPIVEGGPVEFGTSGRLFNSNLVMYDRKTDTLWSQVGGRAIVGKLTGQKLELRTADNVFWKDFKKVHPEAEVLSRETGAFRDYTQDPYGDYYTRAGTIFPLENTDDRLFEKAIVYGLDVKGEAKAYSEEAIKRDKIINDSFAELDLVITIQPSTQAVRIFDRTLRQAQGDNTLTFELSSDRLFDIETGTEWNFDGLAIGGELAGTSLDRINPEFGFWFAWVAFHPNTELYK